MFAIVDTNRIYSSLLSKGKAFEVFGLNSLSKKFEFIAPEFIFFEIGKNFDDIVLRSRLSKEELSGVFSFIKEQIDTIPLENFNMHASEAEKLAPHSKDIQYFALSLAFNKCLIWSDEKAFSKQDEINILDTNKMLEELSKDQNKNDAKEKQVEK